MLPARFDDVIGLAGLGMDLVRFTLDLGAARLHFRRDASSLCLSAFENLVRLAFSLSTALPHSRLDPDGLGEQLLCVALQLRPALLRLS